MNLLTLNIDLSFLNNDVIIAMFVYFICYITYFFFSDFSFVIKFSSRFKETKNNFEKSVYLRRFVGFVLLAIIPFFVMLFLFDKPVSSYGLSLPSGDNTWVWFLIPTLTFVILSIIRSNKRIDIKYYPEVRKKLWNKKRIILNIIFWMLYLLGYELALRGMLFFATVYEFGLWPAILINCLIYAIIHIFKGYKEAYGAFFLGIIFCLITYYTSSIWIAYIIHVLIAVINDLKAIKASKEMEFDI